MRTKDWTDPSEWEDERVSAILTAAEALEEDGEALTRRKDYEAAAACYVASMRLYEEAAKSVTDLLAEVGEDV